jgi:hypothetical protein
MEMPKVSGCSVTDCAYNTNRACHALAITVGEDPSDPTCDTFFKSSTHGGVKDQIAGVGACKASDCDYNEQFECQAPGIEVGMKGSEPDCLTFQTKH